MTIAVQGYPGCFHEEAARKYFNTKDLDTWACDSFNKLADEVNALNNVHLGIMAIENSIAGSILQNYRILRENKFWISGEVFLRIKHNLMVLPGQQIEDLKEVYSHPMAINQCLDFFKNYPHIKLIESEDTALSAKRIRDHTLSGIGAIASETAADIYKLNILAGGIETSKINYTRFFIIQKDRKPHLANCNKASIYLRVSDQPGCLLKALQYIDEHRINISKLQSYPVLGKVSEYYFHLDLEFDELGQYEAVMENLGKVTLDLKELGVYKKASVYDHQTIA